MMRASQLLRMQLEIGENKKLKNSMEMIPVNSRNIASVGYDAESATLRVQFLKGSSYDYQGVPMEVYEGLLAAASKGDYFNNVIRKGGYPFAKLS